MGIYRPEELVLNSSSPSPPLRADSRLAIHRENPVGGKGAIVLRGEALTAKGSI